MALGEVIVAAARILEFGNRRSLLACAVAAGIVLIGSQHELAYQEARRTANNQSARLQLAEQVFPELAERHDAPNPSFVAFLCASARRGRTIGGLEIGAAGVWSLWLLDATITIAAAVTLVTCSLRRPYCDACGSWYRVSRRLT